MTKIKEKKLEFDPVAVLQTIRGSVKLVNTMKEKHGFDLDIDFLQNVTFRHQFSGKMILPLRQMLRSEIEPVKEYLDDYMLQLKRLKFINEKEEKEGFSIEIKGAGTKKQVIDALQNVIYQIENATVTELQQGFDAETETVVFTSDTFESYTGYSIEEDGK